MSARNSKDRIYNFIASQTDRLDTRYQYLTFLCPLLWGIENWVQHKKNSRQYEDGNGGNQDDRRCFISLDLEIWDKFSKSFPDTQILGSVRNCEQQRSKYRWDNSLRQPRHFPEKLVHIKLTEMIFQFISQTSPRLEERPKLTPENNKLWQISCRLLYQ